MEIQRIGQAEDPRLADYVGLTDSQARRLSGGFFIAEGELVVRRLIASDFEVRSVLLTPARLNRMSDVLDEISAPVYVVSQEIMNRVAGFNLHRGAVASAQRRSDPPLEMLIGGTGNLAILEGINDHENLGAIFRTAAGLGIRGVIMDSTTADPFYRRSVRVSMGAVLTVPSVRIGSVVEANRILQTAGIVTVALTPGRHASRLGGLPNTARVAIMLGAEGPGLSDEALATADYRAAIPMAGAVDSLNVSHAAAIAFYHFMP